ncbi:MAG: zinc ribbon domain-containing protein [Chloroflexi bacterium]|nr:zinc ribbon domain-containing protein [Chloroflexota bacterium]
MPVYTYECSQCGDRFEKRQSFSEDPLTVCQCGSAGTVRRVITPVGVVFKGSGFYVTDTRGTNPASTTASNGNGKSSEAGASASKTEPTASKTDATPNKTESTPKQAAAAD